MGVRNVRFLRNLNELEKGVYESLLSLPTQVFICKDDSDEKTSQHCPSGKFSSKSFHEADVLLHLPHILEVHLGKASYLKGLNHSVG